MKEFWIVFCVVLLVIGLCVCCVAAAGLAGVVLYSNDYSDLNASSTAVVIRPEQASTPMVVRPTPLSPSFTTEQPTPQDDDVTSSTPDAVTPDNDITDEPPGWEAVSDETIQTLNNTIVPINDLLDLAARLLGKTGLSPTVEPAPAYDVGDRLDFWVTNVDTNENTRIEAVLRYETEHAYFWLEDGVDYDDDDLSQLAETFEDEIYPINREFFGSEWSPGVDGDPHLYIVYASDLGFSLAGYFSSADSYPPEAHEYSNAHETFMLNADNMDLGYDDTYSTLAHEFQHMIHWYRDRNESSWLNEGFSVLSEFLHGYLVWFDYDFISDPDVQLTDWPTDSSDSPPHYGAGFMFTAYFLDRFGEEATQLLVAEQANGMESVDIVLDEIGATDGLTGEPISAEDLFLDWVIANYLQDDDVADGRYVYHNYPSAPKADPNEEISSCPVDMRTREVHQFGADYINIDCDGDYTLNFEGSVQVGLLPEDAYSGSYAFWSNKGDESDMTITQEFDFSDHDGSLTLSFWTWYDLEEDYDYAYVLASTDGENWQILDAPSCTTLDPSGNSYGCGYNGLSGGSGEWIQEEVDISQFAGQKVQLRFEYITDAAVNGEGILIDDISIPETGYFTDFEVDNGGWESAGFARVTNILPQTFRLALIEHGKDTQVTFIELDETVAIEIPIHIGGDVSSVTLVVTGTTPYTRQKAAYQYEIIP